MALDSSGNVLMWGQIWNGGAERLSTGNFIGCAKITPQNHDKLFIIFSSGFRNRNRYICVANSMFVLTDKDKMLKVL